MRSAIIGAFFKDSPEKRRDYVLASTRLTHTDPKAEAAALAVAECAAWGAGDRAVSRENLPAELRALSPEDEWQRAFDLISEHLLLTSPVSVFAEAMGLSKGVTGYAFHTVPVAIYGWLRHPADFRHAVISVIECGGDTDTAGAITGAMAGAALGSGAIPGEWVTGIRDWPLSVTVLRRAAGVLAGNGQRFPGLFWPFVLLRNLALLTPRPRSRPPPALPSLLT